MQKAQTPWQRLWLGRRLVSERRRFFYSACIPERRETKDRRSGIERRDLLRSSRGVADRLGITTVMVPPDAGLLSALGLRDAVLERFASEQVLGRLDELDGVELRCPARVTGFEQGEGRPQGVEGPGALQHLFPFAGTGVVTPDPRFWFSKTRG